MNEALLFGAASALLYGVTNLVARFANKETGVLRTMLWGQALMAVLLTLAVLIRPVRLDVPPLQWLILLERYGEKCQRFSPKISRQSKNLDRNDVST